MAPKGKTTKGDAKKKDDVAGKEKVKGAQSINVRHILCEKKGKIDQAATKLNEGAKFDDVAREFSEDKAKSGGALGWKLRGDLDPIFADAAFELAASNTAKPIFKEVKTGFGYHLVMVEGRK